MSETKHNFPGGTSFFFPWVDHETPVNAINLDWIGFEFHQVEYNIGTNAQGGHGTLKGRFENNESRISAVEGDYVKKLGGEFEGHVGFNYYNIEYGYIFQCYFDDSSEYTIKERVVNNENGISAIEGDYVKKLGGSFEGHVGFNYYNVEYCYAFKVYLPDQNEKDLQERIVELENAKLPSGVILIWSGAIVDVPNGWVICDGNNGTPDLRDKFIVGAGSSYGVEDTGGENTHTLVEGEIPAHTHGAIANHSHSYTRYRTTWRINTGTTANVWYDASAVGTGGAGGHTHSSMGGDAAHENRPPYFALAFIMKT